LVEKASLLALLFLAFDGFTLLHAADSGGLRGMLTGLQPGASNIQGAPNP